MTTTSYICKSCCHFLRDGDAFRNHVAKHGIDMSKGFQITAVGQHRGSGWSQATEMILTDHNFEFFKTTTTIDTKSQLAFESNGQMVLVI